MSRPAPERWSARRDASAVAAGRHRMSTPRFLCASTHRRRAVRGVPPRAISKTIWRRHHGYLGVAVSCLIPGSRDSRTVHASSLRGTARGRLSRSTRTHPSAPPRTLSASSNDWIPPFLNRWSEVRVLPGPPLFQGLRQARRPEGGRVVTCGSQGAASRSERGCSDISRQPSSTPIFSVGTLAMGVLSDHLHRHSKVPGGGAHEIPSVARPRRRSPRRR